MLREIGGRNEARLQRGLDFAAGAADAGGAKLLLKETQLGIAAHVAHHHEGLTCAHPLSIAHQDFADDAAFLMLHGLAVQFDFDLTVRYDGARQRGSRRPEGHQARNDCHRQKHAPSLSSELGTGVRIAGPLCEQLRKCHWMAGFHALASIASPACTVAGRLEMADTACLCGNIVEAGPKASSTPSFNTASLSSCDMRAGRCPTMMVVTPRALSSTSAAARAPSPCASRLAFGSSSTTRRGFP